MFVSVDGKAKEVKEIFAGGSDGLAHKVTEVFGSVNGIANTIYTDSPYEYNAFNQYTWQEIKEIADEGVLHEYFNKYDVVDIKLKEPLIGFPGTANEFQMDHLPMTISQISPTGMQLVSRLCVPYTWKLNPNELYITKNSNTAAGQWYNIPNEIEFTMEGLYDGCKKIHDALPDDMKEVLTTYKALTKYEYGYDEEGKYRLMSKYDNNLTVRHATSHDFEWENIYNEEKGRWEQVMTKSFYDNKTKSAYMRYFPEGIRNTFIYDGERYTVSHRPRTASFRKLRYRSPYPNYPATYEYTLILTDPVHGWKWDWENWQGVNQLDLNGSPEFTANSGSADLGSLSLLIPQVQIGTME